MIDFYLKKLCGKRNIIKYRKKNSKEKKIKNVYRCAHVYKYNY